MLNRPPVEGDTAYVRVIPGDRVRMDDLPGNITDYKTAQLQRMTENWSSPVLSFVPGFRYWELDERRKMNRPDNVCGYQQRAFDFYWAIRAGVSVGQVMLGVGSTNIPGPCVLGTDKYHGEDTPDPERYGLLYGFPHLHMDAEENFPFFAGMFGGCIANHVLEHLTPEKQEHVLREMLRVTRTGGVVCIVMPDMTFSRRGSIDPTHHCEWGADGYLQFLDSLKEIEDFPPFEVVEHNTFDNAFSFNTVLIRR